MIGRYRDISYEVVEADMAPEGLELVRAKLGHLCECYLSNNAEALRTLFTAKRIARCYTFLPDDMSAELRNMALSNEHCCWEFDHFAENKVVLRPNVSGGTVVWRYVSRDCLREKSLQFIGGDVHNICALGAYDEKSIEKQSDCQDTTKRIGDLLCFGETLLRGPIPEAFDTTYFDLFGFMTKLPAIAPERKHLAAHHFTNEVADDLILASSHVFMAIHEEDSICIMDLEACSGAAVLEE